LEYEAPQLEHLGVPGQFPEAEVIQPQPAMEHPVLQLSLQLEQPPGVLEVQVLVNEQPEHLHLHSQLFGAWMHMASLPNVQHTLGEAHAPQVPPQPSGPQFLPLQLGTHFWASGAGDVSLAIPPSATVALTGLQTFELPAETHGFPLGQLDLSHSCVHNPPFPVKAHSPLRQSLLLAHSWP